MPTYVETDSMRIVVLPDGQRRSGATYREVDLDAVLRLGLNDGYRVTREQLDELLGDAFSTAQSPSAARPGDLRTPGVPPSVGRSNGEGLPHSVDEARGVAVTVGAIGYLILILSVIAGLLVAAQTETVDSYFGGGDERVYPHVWQGLGIAFAGSFQALLVIMIAKYIEAKMEIAKAQFGR